MLGEKLSPSSGGLDDDFDRDIQLSFKARSTPSVRAKLPTLAGGKDKAPRFTNPPTSRRPKMGHARATKLGFTPRQQRSVVKGSYSDKPGAWAAHVRYLDREKANQDIGFFSELAEDIPRADVLERVKEWENDPRVWKFSVSPENSAELDMKEHTKKFMLSLEKQIGRKLEWYAVEHTNTDNGHTHLLVRGVDRKNKQYMLAPGLVYKLHELSAEIATQDLGYRTEREVIGAREKSIHAERFTELDRELIKLADKEQREVDLSQFETERARGHTVEGTRDIQRQYFARLKVLQTMGLAERVPDNEVPKGKPTGYLWRLSPAMEPALRQYQLTHDIAKRLHRDMTSMDPASKLVAHVNGLKEPVMGRIVSMGMDDELKDKRFVLIEGLDGRSHYIHQPNAMKIENAKEQYKPGHLIRLTPREFEKDGRKIAYMKLENFGDTRNPEHLRDTFTKHLDEHLLRKNADLHAGMPSDHPTRIQREMAAQMRKRAIVLARAGLLELDEMAGTASNTSRTLQLRREGVIQKGRIVDMERWQAAVTDAEGRKRATPEKQVEKAKTKAVKKAPDIDMG
jgi:type IV secretory pathway VirD2 relaxase